MPDYAYINTRIRSMEADLLSERHLRELISFRELSGAVTYLKKTIYGIYFPEGLEESLIGKVDTALRTALSDLMHKMNTLFKGDSRVLIEVLLGRWDIFNIKTLLRGKLNNISAQEVLSATVPAGSLDEGMLREVYKQPSVQAMLDMLLTIGYSYIAPLTKIKYLHEGDLFRGEIALENAFFVNALRRLDASGEKGINIALAEDTIRMLIDRYNLIAAVRMAEDGLRTDEAAGYFIEGGKRITLSVYKRVTRGRDINECISMIGNATLQRRWEGFSPHSRITSPTLLVERWMDYEMLDHAVRLPREDPFHVGLAISHIWKKVNEVINLRIILHGIHYNLPQVEIEELLIIL